MQMPRFDHSVVRLSGRPRAGSLPGFALITAALLLASAAVAQRNVAIPPLRGELVVTTDWLADHMNDPHVVVLHVAEKRADYDAGHIPGARFVPLDKLATARHGLNNELPPVGALERLFAQTGVDDGSRVVLYGDHSGLAAARAYWTLDYLGHGDRTALLDGGLEKWRTEERPVVQVTPAVTHGKFTAKVNRRVLATMDDVAEAVKTRSAVLIDARPAKEYSGETPVDILPRAGHIPGATNLYWQELIESKDDPQLKPPPEMRQRFAQAGATPEKKIVIYCRTGVQAAFDYFAAKFLGYDVSLYDGSFQEWSNTNHRVIGPTNSSDNRVIR